MHIFITHDEFSNLHYAAFYSSKNFNYETNFLLFSLYILDPRLHKKLLHLHYIRMKLTTAKIL